MLDEESDFVCRKINISDLGGQPKPVLFRDELEQPC